MSYGAWGEGEDFSGPGGYVSEERAEEMFIAGAQAMRELIALFLENDVLPTTPVHVRNTWQSSWGPDPGKPESVMKFIWD